jgi:hypothetical protein
MGSAIENDDARARSQLSDANEDGMGLGTLPYLE